MEEQISAERAAGSRALWRLECAHHFAGAVEAQVLMAAGAAADNGHDSTPVLWAAWEFCAGAGLIGSPTLRPGEIWLAEMDKTRPAVVMHRDFAGRVLNDVPVVPLTTTMRDIPTAVRLGPADGVDRDSVALLDSPTLLRKDRFVQHRAAQRREHERALQGTGDSRCGVSWRRPGGRVGRRAPRAGALPRRLRGAAAGRPPGRRCQWRAAARALQRG